MKKNNIQG